MFARNKCTSEWIGVQCKVKANGKITKKKIEREINLAKGSNPQLESFYFYITDKRDAKIQEYIREKSVESILADLFDIQIYFWGDIEMMLMEEQFKGIHYKYYRGFYSNIEDNGFAFGKLINLTIGHRNYTSNYELLIGKTYKENTSGFYCIDYWKDIYIFPIPCYPSDLETAIKSRKDSYIICQWINSIKDFDKFLTTREENYQFLITDERFGEYKSY